MMISSKLDLYLSKGYFRMQQDLFTCRYLFLEREICPVHWLRIVVADVEFGKKQLRLFRINEAFLVRVRPFTGSHELETLYAQYRQAIDFDAPESVKACLLGDTMANSFDTYVVEVRDGSQLIAAGIFDNGLNSMAGIMNFYHPDYRKYSLGKYLMLLKIRFAQQAHKSYYYPGYIVSGYPKFDYKLFACETATEVLDENTGTWYPFSWERVASLADKANNEFLP